MWTTTTEGCKSVTDNLWFSSITSLLTPLHQYHVPVTGNVYICVIHAKTMLLLHTHHLQPFTLSTDSGYWLWKVSVASVLKSSKPHDKITSFETHFTWFFPWETADEYLHQGKGGKIQTIVRFSVKTLIILNLVSWNGLHRSNIFKMIVCWENTVRHYYICVGNHYVSDSCEFHAALIRRYTSRSPFTIHILLNLYPHMLPIIMYIFSKWKFLKQYLVQYSLMIQYGPIFSTHQHEHKTSMLDN